jgi:hypothetical protein
MRERSLKNLQERLHEVIVLSYWAKGRDKEMVVASHAIVELVEDGRKSEAIVKGLLFDRSGKKTDRCMYSIHVIS